MPGLAPRLSRALLAVVELGLASALEARRILLVGCRPQRDEQAANRRGREGGNRHLVIVGEGEMTRFDGQMGDWTLVVIGMKTIVLQC